MAKYWRHTITCGNDSDSVILYFSPKGWDTKGYTFQQNENYNGILSSFSIGKLGFINDKGSKVGGKDFILSKYDLYGVEAKLTDLIEVRNPVNNQYKTWNNVKLSWLEDAEQAENAEDEAFYMKIVDNDDKERFRENDELGVNVLSEKDLEGNNITVKETVSVLTTEQEVYVSGQISNESISYSPNFTVEPTPDFIQFAASGSLVDNSNTRSYLPSAPSSFELYRNDSGEDKNLTIQFVDGLYCKLQGAVLPLTGTVEFDFYTKLEVYDETDSLVNTQTAYSVNSGVLNATDEFDLSGSGELSYTNLAFPDGYYVKLVIRLDYTVTDTTQIIFDLLEYSNGKINILERTDVIAASRTRMLLAFEACENLLQIITGNTSPLYSTILGRTDLGYTTDGFLSLFAFTNGWLIRQFGLNTKELSLSFKKVFKTLNAIKPIYLYYDNDNSRFVIEDLDERYSNDVMHTVNYPANFKRIFAGDLYYNLIKIGQANKVEYDSLNGAEEASTPTDFSTSLSFKNTYDIQAPYNLDATGIEVLRQSQRSRVGNLDTKNDSVVYCLDLERNGLDLQTRVLAAGEEAVNVFNGDTRLNLRVTPKRNMLRHGSILSSIYHKNTSGVYTFLNSQLSSDLGTKLTGESLFLYENTDVSVSDLSERYFIPERIEFSSDFTNAFLDELLINPHRLIKVVTKIGDFYGYIDTEGVRSEAYNRTGNYTLLVRNYISSEVLQNSFDFRSPDNSQYTSLLWSKSLMLTD